MSGERRETFRVGERPELEVRLASGSVRVVQGATGTVDVRVRGRDLEAFVIEQHGDHILLRTPPGMGIRWRDYEVDVTAPPEVVVKAGLASADLAIDGSVAGLRLDLASGDCRARSVTGDVAIKSASGDIDLGDVGGEVSISSASGDVRLRRLGGGVTVTTASGAIGMDAVEGDVRAKSASGDIEVRGFGGTDLRAMTMSGDVWVGLPHGRTVDVDLSTLSGRVRNNFAMEGAGNANGDRVRLRVKTVSGDITLANATG